MKKRYKLLYVIKNMFKQFVEWIVKNSWFLMFIVLVALNIMISISYLKNAAKCCLIAVLFLVQFVCIKLYIVLKIEDNKLPKHTKRFTYKDQDANICVDTDEWPEAILYLNDIENYIEKNTLQSL